METKLYKKTFYKLFGDRIFLFNSFTNCSTSIKYDKNISIEQNICLHGNKLLSDGILLNTNDDYNKFLDFFYNKSTYDTRTLTITDAPWFDCNLKCIYCMQQNTNTNVNLLNKSLRADAFINLCDFFGASTLNICFFGGEPFLFNGYISTILDRIKDSHINLGRISAVTNGTIISDHIKTINDYNINSLQITLDGVRSVHDSRRFTKNNAGTFDIIISSMTEILNSTNATIIVNTVLDKNNYDNYLEMIDYLSNLFNCYMFGESPRIIFNLGNECNPYQSCDYTEQNTLGHTNEIWLYYSILDMLIDKGVAINSIIPSPSCMRDNFSEFIVGPDGYLYNCISGIGIPDFKICDCVKLFNQPESSLMKLILMKGAIKTNTCSDCAYSGMCNGGCLYDSMNSNNPLCQKNKFDSSIDKLMDILYKVEEIDTNVFRKKLGEYS